MTSAKHLEAYGKLAGYVMQTTGLTDASEMEAQVLSWFADRQQSNPDWWETWEEHTRSGRILEALQMYTKLALGQGALSTPKTPSTPKAPEPKPEEKDESLTGGIFDL